MMTFFPQAYALIIGAGCHSHLKPTEKTLTFHLD
jgi:hypothetical protein